MFFDVWNSCHHETFPMNTSIPIIFTPGIALAWILFWICRSFSRVRILNNPLTSGQGWEPQIFHLWKSAKENQSRQWNMPPWKMIVRWKPPIILFFHGHVWLAKGKPRKPHFGRHVPSLPCFLMVHVLPAFLSTPFFVGKTFNHLLLEVAPGSTGSSRWAWLSLETLRRFWKAWLWFRLAWQSHPVASNI